MCGGAVVRHGKADGCGARRKGGTTRTPCAQSTRVFSPKMDAAIAKLTPENVKLALTCLYALAGAPKGSHA